MKSKTMILGLLTLIIAVMLGTVGNAAAGDTVNCTMRWPNTTSIEMNLTTGYNTLEVYINATNGTGGSNVSVSWYATPEGGSEILLIANTTVFGNATVVQADVGNISRTAFTPAAYTNMGDGTTYTITAKTFLNGSSTAYSGGSCSQTLIYFDRTKPVVSISSPTTGSEVEPPFTVDVTGVNASRCTIYVGATGTGSFSTSYNMTRILRTIGSESYEWTFDGKYNLPDGIYDFKATCTDTGGSNSTTSTNYRVEVYESPSAMKGVIIEEDLAREEAAKKSDPVTTLAILGGLGLLFYLLTKKK